MKVFGGILCALLVVTFGSSAGAVVIGFEDFDGGAINLSSTANVLDFGAGGGSGGDVFGRVSQYAGGSGTGGPFDVFDDSVVDTSGGGAPFPGDTRGLSGQNGTAFFAMNDMDGTGIPTVMSNATWTFDISSALSVSDITIDIAAMGDFEATTLDGFTIAARIDANPFQTIFQGITDEATNKTYRLMDLGTVPSDTFDPLELYVDGAATGIFLDKSDPVTGLFDSYTSTLLAGGSGSTLDIQISWAGAPSGSEPMGFDNITINGVIPEPTTLALLGLGALAMAFRRRR